VAAADIVRLEPWVVGKKTTALRAWSSAQLQPTCDRLTDAAHEWAAAWGLPPSADKFCARAATSMDVGRTGWTTLAGPSGGIQGWLGATDRAGLHRTLWDHGPVGRLAPQLVDRCVADAAARLAASLGIVPAAATDERPDSHHVLPWSGAVVFEQSGDGWRFLLLLLASAIEPVGAGAPSLVRPGVTSLTDAMHDRRMTLQVRLQGCSLDLGALSGLRIGDVVRLEHPVEQPTALTDRHGRPCFEGHLARHGDRKTVVLAKCVAGVERREP
jgi:hypothetical protein